MTTATHTRIDLTAPYARECAAHLLAGAASSLGESISRESRESDEPPCVDRMIMQGFDVIVDPFLEDLGRLAKITRALETVAEGADSVEWPLTPDDYGANDPAVCLRESMGDVPALQLVKLAEAVPAAEAFVASLRDEVTA